MDTQIKFVRCVSTGWIDLFCLSVIRIIDFPTVAQCSDGQNIVRVYLRTYSRTYSRLGYMKFSRSVISEHYVYTL